MTIVFNNWRWVRYPRFNLFIINDDVRWYYFFILDSLSVAVQLAQCKRVELLLLQTDCKSTTFELAYWISWRVLLQTRRGVALFSRPSEANLNGAPFRAHMRGYEIAHKHTQSQSQFCLSMVAAAANPQICGPENVSKRTGKRHSQTQVNVYLQVRLNSSSLVCVSVRLRVCM